MYSGCHPLHTSVCTEYGLHLVSWPTNAGRLEKREAGKSLDGPIKLLLPLPADQAASHPHPTESVTQQRCDKSVLYGCYIAGQAGPSGTFHGYALCNIPCGKRHASPGSRVTARRPL